MENEIKVNGRPRSFDNPEVLKALIEQFLSQRQAESKPLTMAGLCVHLSVSKDTLWEYMRGKYDENDLIFSEPIKMAKLFIEDDKLQKMLKGQYHAIAGIFDLKNNHGYTDKIEQTHQAPGGKAMPLNEVITLDDATRAYQEAVKGNG